MDGKGMDVRFHLVIQEGVDPAVARHRCLPQKRVGNNGDHKMSLSSLARARMADVPRGDVFNFQNVDGSNARVKTLANNG